MIEYVLDSNKQIFLFAKDKNLKYLFCNEATAEAAGLDSPRQIIGKTDYDLFWRKHAELYRSGDTDVIHGKTKINASEIQTQPTRVANILICKMILPDREGYPGGVTGHYIDVSGYTVKKNNGHEDRNKNIFFLGPNFGNEYLTKKEFSVFKYLLLGFSVEKMSKLMFRSISTIKSQINSIARKLQCTHKSEIVPTAVKFGLTYVLDGITLERNL